MSTETSFHPFHPHLSNPECWVNFPERRNQFCGMEELSGATEEGFEGQQFQIQKYLFFTNNYLWDCNSVPPTVAFPDGKDILGSTYRFCLFLVRKCKTTILNSRRKPNVYSF